jgi:uncharacterized membrane protein YecN with MAPEG domain
MLEITALSAAVLTMLMTGLSLNVSRLRIRHRQSYGDGNHADLRVAIRLHGNTLEQSVLFLVLLMVWEMSQPNMSAVVVASGVFVFSRLLYVAGVQTRRLAIRQGAHVLTLVCQLAVCIGLIMKVLA